MKQTNTNMRKTSITSSLQEHAGAIQGGSSPELLQRYLFAVGKRLPEKNREDIVRELESDILERMESMDAALQDGGIPNPADSGEIAEKRDIALEAILREFGDPESVSLQYGGRPDTLIGADLFPLYKTVLKLALVIALCVLSFVFLIGIVFSPTGVQGTIGMVVNWMTSLFQAALSTFAYVTLSFAVAERVMAKQGKRHSDTGEAWSPAQLPLLPQAADRVNQAGVVTGLLFTLFFAGILLLRREWLGVVLKASDWENLVVVPLFNESLVNPYLYLLLGLMGLSVVVSIWKLVAGRFTQPIRILSAISSFLGALFVLIFLNQPDVLVSSPALVATLGDSGTAGVMTALQLSLRITSAAIAIPLAIEGIGHVRQLMRQAH